MSPRDSIKMWNIRLGLIKSCFIQLCFNETIETSESYITLVVVERNATDFIS